MQIIFTTPAKRRLKKIYAYYEKASSKRIAESITNDIVTATEMLFDQPFAGQKEEFLEDLKQGHRRIVSGNHKIIYRIIGNTVYITDIFDSRQNPTKMMK